MDWVPWVLDIPVDVAQEKGFYAGHGLKVKQTLPAGATDVAKFVAAGKAQFGLYYAPDTLMGVAAGAPLLSVASLMSHAPVGMAMAPGVHARTPADLAGTTAGVVMIPSTRASFATMLEGRRCRPRRRQGRRPRLRPGRAAARRQVRLGRGDRVRRARPGRSDRAEARLPRLPRLGHARLRVPQRADPEGVRRRASGDGQGLRGGHAAGPRLGRRAPRRGGGHLRGAPSGAQSRSPAGAVEGGDPVDGVG